MAWVNEFLETDYAKVEECADGAVYVQLCDSIFNLKDNQMKKVKWGSNSKIDWGSNWKIVQDCFHKHGVSKPIDVAKILNGKFQDNLEVMQWFKHFHECKYSGVNYDAKKRRNLSSSAPKKSKKTKQRSVTRKKNENSTTERKTKKAAGKRKKLKESEDKLQGLLDAVDKATQTIEAVEKERNFYFGKLREIEILCQDDNSGQDDNNSDQDTLVSNLQKAVLEIMYKTGEGSDMVSPQSEEDVENQDSNAEDAEDDPNQTF